MSEQDKSSEKFYSAFSSWLNEFKAHELTDLVGLVEQVKQYAIAAESIPKEKVVQFIDNFSYDLTEFYRHNQEDIKHSSYITLLQENFWQQLAQITDKSQVEWSELVDDFSHDGEYHNGDFVGFGELICQNCQHKQLVTHLTQLTSCIECGGASFKRSGLEP